MTKSNTFTFHVYYHLPSFDPQNGLCWVAHESLATVLLPSCITTEDQASEYLYEQAMSCGHEHVHYENFILHDEDSDSEI